MVKRIAAAALAVAALSISVPAQSGYYHTPGTPSEPGRRYDNANNPYCRSIFRNYDGEDWQSKPDVFGVENRIWRARYSVMGLERSTTKLSRAVSISSPDLNAIRKHAAKIRKTSDTALAWYWPESEKRRESGVATASPRPLTMTLGDVADIERLVNDVTTVVLDPKGVLALDEQTEKALQSNLVQIRALAWQVETDLARKSNP